MNIFHEIQGEIATIICLGEGISMDDVKKKTRKREIVFTRQLIMYFFRKMIPKISLSLAGAYFEKDHATVEYSCKTIQNLYDTDKSVRRKVDMYEEKIIEYIKLSEYINKQGIDLILDKLTEIKEIMKIKIDNESKLSANIINLYNNLILKKQMMTIDDEN